MPRGGFELVGDDVKLRGEVIEHVGSEEGGGSGKAGDDPVSRSPVSPDPTPPQP